MMTVHCKTPAVADARTEMREHEERPEAIFVIAAGAVFGAVVGFLLSGKVSLAAATICAMTLGIGIGWWTRGIGDAVDD
ncbi:hypothetical protein [Bradyrhizobium genosp. P]|uniref:hypothetical protein n=1 Tax=Bradyrhizobium genosp. P TaxID=83641 RepID=UPI003CEB8E36